MVRTSLNSPGLRALLIIASAAAGCNTIVGLDKLSVAEDDGQSGGKPSSGGSGATSGSSNSGGTSQAGVTGEGGEAPMGECSKHKDCVDEFRLENPDVTPVPAIVCIKPEGRCVPVLSEDCDVITGDPTDDNAIFIGSLFSTRGAQAATNVPRQQAAALGVEQLNQAGGIPTGETSADGRKLVMVSCDESTDLLRAGRHLVNDLKVPAIIGPNTSQDTLDVSTQLTVEAGTVVITPTAVASSITALTDNDLTWLMVPSDVQRSSLMMSQLNTMEQALRAEREDGPVKLGIVFRNDALGLGTRTSLNALEINDAGLTDSINLGNNVRIDPYQAADPDQEAIVENYVKFAPDIIVLIGTAEVITKVMVPLEMRWTAPVRPLYMLMDSTKTPELLTAVTGNPNGLQGRIRGTGITPGPMGANTPYEAFNGFKIDYDARYKGAASNISGMGSAHDAAFAIGLALAATKDEAVTGKTIAKGLRMLNEGTRITTIGTNALGAFQKLAAGKGVRAIGSFGPLDWNEDGAPVGGTLEMWCIGGAATKPAYTPSGLTQDIESQEFSGTYKPCNE